MATTYTAAKVGSDVTTREHESVNIVKSEYALTGALVVNDVIQMVKVPLGAVICQALLYVTDLDTGGSPAIVLDVGDGSDTDRFIDGSTAGQAGGVTTINVATGPGYTYAADDTIDVLVQVAPATGATTGTIGLLVTYTLQA